MTNTPDLEKLTREIEAIYDIWHAATTHQWNYLPDGNDLHNHPAAYDLVEQCQNLECEASQALALDETTYYWADSEWVHRAFQNGIPEELADWRTHWITKALTQHHTPQPTELTLRQQTQTINLADLYADARNAYNLASKQHLDDIQDCYPGSLTEPLRQTLADALTTEYDTDYENQQFDKLPIQALGPQQFDTALHDWYLTELTHIINQGTNTP